MDRGGTRYVAAIPYGLNGGNEFSLYLPGTAAEFIPEECRSWNGEAYGLYPGTVCTTCGVDMDFSRMTMQHPLAKIEIVRWNSSLTLIFSRRKVIIDDVMRNPPQSEKLEAYICRL